MNFFSWLAGHFSDRGKALASYKRGMAKATKHDHEGAIVDYTTTIGMPDAPVDVKAMALFNRALAHIAGGNQRNGVDDLDAVLAMDGALVNVRTMARQKLIRMESLSHKSNV